MDLIMINLDLDRPLPAVIAIKYAENHLYRIGLSLFSFGFQKSNRFHNLFFISLIICVQILESITAILMKEDLPSVRFFLKIFLFICALEIQLFA
jgi:hypothetical protein